MGGGIGVGAAAEEVKQRVEAIYLAAKTRHLAEPTNAVAAWHFGRGCFDWAEAASKDSARAAIAREGAAACRRALDAGGESGPAYYYLALNLGQLARTKSIGALRLVKEMEEALTTAARIDPAFDYGGPDRALGLLYLKAPGWPASIGNRARARRHLTTAAELSPEFPENGICLLEALLKWGEIAEFKRQMGAWERTLKKASVTFKGKEWERAWMEWTARWEALDRELKKGQTGGLR